MIATTVTALIFAYLFVNIVAVLWRNKEAHKFFEKNSPRLPVLPEPSIIDGHGRSLLSHDKNWKLMEEFHEKYGPTFGFYKMNEPWVATKDLDLIKLIEIDEAHKHINRANLGIPLTEFNHSVWQLEDDKWRKVRRVISAPLTNHKVRSDEVSSDIQSVVHQLAASLERRMKRAQQGVGGGRSASLVLDARDLSDRFALAVIFLISYKQKNIIDFDSEQDSWTEGILSGARGIINPVNLLSMMFPFMRPVCQILAQFHSTGRSSMRIASFIRRATDKNRVLRLKHQQHQQEGQDSFANAKSSGDSKRSLADTIIDSYLGKKINYDNFIGSLLFLLVAGFITTADTLSCLLWQLARHPDIQDKLRRTLVEEGIDADYVVWCLNETVRYHPAVPLGAGRVLGEDVEINGQFLAKGTFVMPTTHGIHHDPKIWPEPERFNPDRWRDQTNFHPAAFMGFGLGPRNCVGARLAMHEMKLAIQMILTSYKVELCDETPDEWRFSTPGLIYTLNDEPIKIKLSALADSARC